MPWITKEGRTVEEAQDAAVAASGLPVDELEVEVVSEGAKGLFGLGGEPAVVRVRAKDEAQDVRHAFRDDITPGPDDVMRPRAQVRAPAPEPEAPVAERVPPSVVDERPAVRDAPLGGLEEPDAAGGFPGEDEPGSEEAGDKLSLSEQQEQASTLGEEIVRGILKRMGLEGDVNTRVAGGTVYIEVFGDEMGILIGRGGATLEALQELVRAGVQRRLKTRQALVVDVEAYWERRRTNRRREGGERRGDDGRRRGGDRRGKDGGGNREERSGNR